MPGRWPGKVPQFAGKPWSPFMGRSLDEFLRNIHKGMSNLQGTPGTPETVSGTSVADPGTGPAPALDDHVHDLDVTGTPVSVGTTNLQGTGAGIARTNHQHRVGIVSNKGDILVSNGTNPIALGVGANGLVLAADSTTASGLVWSSVAADAELLAIIGL
jgi:hypothetical protein